MDHELGVSKADAKDNRAVRVNEGLLKPWLDMVERASFVDPSIIPLLTTDQVRCPSSACT